MEPLSQLDYFTEWGGKTWQGLVRTAVQYVSDGGRMDQLRVLDVGTRYGKMALFFSLLGAQVTGVDISQQALAIARQETNMWRARHTNSEETAHNINFVAYDGSLDVLADRSFDVVFTKSVLVVVPDLRNFLEQVSKKLDTCGKIVFLENARGSKPLHLLRAVKHRHWDYRQAHYFVNQDVELVRSIFNVEIVQKTLWPPVYLILGKKQSTS